MTTTTSVSEYSFPLRILKLPFTALWFLLRHPILCLFIALLLAVGTFSTLAHFNPKIAEHFNNTVAYFVGATIASDLASTVRRMQSDFDTLSTRLHTTEAELEIQRKKSATYPEQLEDMKKTKAENTKLRNQIEQRDTRIANLNRDKSQLNFQLDRSEKRLADTNGRLRRFGNAGKKIEAQIPNRFTKVALYDGAGEFLGFIPILGDAASIGMTFGGLYEMCQMFKEIEQATTELHVPYKIYTGTFCQDPAGKSKEALIEVTVTARKSFMHRYEQFKNSVKTTFSNWFRGGSKQHSLSSLQK